MFKLRLFGTPQLEGPAGALPSPGPRRLAALASLAAAGAAGLTRDKLIARLWPETDEDRARRNLSQLLYAMRTELGAELVEGTGTLRLDPAQCSSDVATFDAAIAEGRDAEAVAVYLGEFLDGFHLSDSAEFEAWSEAERSRRATQAVAASVRVATAVPASDLHASAAAWRRAVALDPVNARTVRRAMDALAADEDRAGAIRVGEQYAARVRSEFDAEPDSAVLTRLDELRRAPGGTAAGAGGGATRTSRLVEGPVASDAPVSTPVHGGPRAAARTRWNGIPRRRSAFLVAGTVVLGLGALFWGRQPASVLREGEFVIIAEFVNRTGDTLLTRTVGSAMTAALQQSARVTPLPRARVAAALVRMQRPDTTERLDLSDAREVAEREGVRLVIAGEVIAAGPERQVIGRVIEARSGRIVATRTARASTDADLLAAIDRLAAAMRLALGDAAAAVTEAVPLPDVTTSSLAALHYFAEAREASRRNNEDLAISLYARAVATDSTFASAHAQLGAAYARNNNLPRSAFHFQRALAQADRLPLDELLTIQIADAYARGDLGVAVHYSRSYLARRPRDAGAWLRLAFYLYISGQDQASREAYAEAEKLAPLPTVGILNLGSTWLSNARRTGQREGFDSARFHYERAFRLDPALEYNTFYNQQYGAILIGAGLPDSARATFDRMTARGSLDRARGLRSNGFLDALVGDWSRAASAFADAALQSTADRQWTSALRNEALHADLLLTIGDRAAAEAPLGRATAIALRETLEARALAFVALAQVKAGGRREAEAVLARMRRVARPENAGERAVILAVEGAQHLAAGRAAAARTALRTAFVEDSLSLQIQVLYARALVAVGEDSAALAAWDQAARTAAFGYEGQFDWQFADYERGRLHERLGRPEEAAAAYRRLVARYPVTAGRTDPREIREARERLTRLESARP